MTKLLFTIILIFTSVALLSGQNQVDLTRSVPVWMEYDSTNNQPVLKWIGDNNATNYYVSEGSTNTTLIPLDTLENNQNEFPLGSVNNAEYYNFHIRKDNTGRGIISLGIEIPMVHERGRCLIAIDDLLADSLEVELEQLMNDLAMDAWEVDTMLISQDEEVVVVKSKISDWFDADYQNSQSLFLLGHIPVPYSGNSAYDGHANHQGAWSADTYYGDLDGTWTDATVNNETPSRAENKNVPGDGKFDQTTIPSEMELEIGRVDFHNLPAFPQSEIELTRQYLNKNHEFKTGEKEYPRRALIENNFGSFAEGFGQSGWRNFTTMFRGNNVSTQNYEVELETNKYLFSYACGGGSYTSCSGVGTTQSLWVAKNIQTIFTLNFGSYFGDWDSQNNFLRSALASGDVLTNAWAGRPVWQLFDMPLGKHIGFSTKRTQDARGAFYNQGFGVNSAHIALMGDPTLRLHAMKMPANLLLNFENGNINLNWNPSPDADNGYAIYRKKDNSQWEFLSKVESANSYIDDCVDSNTEYTYIVKAVKLEQTGSGSYFNTSLGISKTIVTDENQILTTFYADADMDGYGDIENTRIACVIPTGFVDNSLDCNDANSAINPEATEIPNNNIDENCDGEDLISGLTAIDDLKIQCYPNPTSGIIMVERQSSIDLSFRIYNAQGQVIQFGELNGSINISDEANGIYWLEVISPLTKSNYSQLLMLSK